MEIIIILVIAMIGLVFFIKVMSSSETKLFRKIWSAQLAKQRAGFGSGVYDQAYKKENNALDELKRLYNISIVQGVEGDQKAKLGKGLGNLIAKVVEFDVSYQNNMGVRIAPIVIHHLQSELNNAGITDFDEKLAIGSVDHAAMVQEMTETLADMDIEKYLKMDEDEALAEADEAERLTTRYNLMKSVWASHQANNASAVDAGVAELMKTFEMEASTADAELEDKIMDITKHAAVFDVQQRNMGDEKLVAVVATTLKSKLNAADIMNFDEQLERIEGLDWDTLVSLVSA